MMTSCIPGSATRLVFASTGTDVSPEVIDNGVPGVTPAGPTAIEPAKFDMLAGTSTITGSKNGIAAAKPLSVIENGNESVMPFGNITVTLDVQLVVCAALSTVHVDGLCRFTVAVTVVRPPTVLPESPLMMQPLSEATVATASSAVTRCLNMVFISAPLSDIVWLTGSVG